ncbi:LysR family transcriptional regulator [Lactobacillus sp. ESL0785]|uniref:LysR family transcriptional regulator n=1 Tax=Lactobacillus sp. ESL0785 TaxID=2983232 RepID=UPI0023F65B22|nr:LysR family transcriptional regulator [Lactobacillus sp. ESL0785]WEV71320.1 LysR family transcriptional regulator [Lactobacillus sp. ESL0785]
MNLNQLYYFREVADQKQYTKAAANLFIGQPTLSVAIKQLESELNCQLFIHSGHNVVLTKYGRNFYATVTKTLNSLENGKKRLTQMVSQDQHNIHIASIPTAIGTLLPKIVKKFKTDSLTKAHFIYHDNPSLQICQGINAGRYDLGICSFVPEFDNFTYLPLYTEDIIAIVAKESNLAEITEISPEELRGDNLITYSQNIQIGKDVTAALLASTPDLTIINRLHDELAIAGQVIADNAVGIVANTIYLSGFSIHKIKLTLPKNTRQVYLVYNSDRELSPEILNFIDFLKSNKDFIQKTVTQALI